MHNSIRRVATLYLIAKPVQTTQDALNTLYLLDELADNIEEVTSTFNLHYRTAAAVSTEVKSQFAALGKANAGLVAAKNVVNSLKEIVKTFPDDKTAIRGMKDAETMLKRFTKLKQEASDMLQKISKGEMPDSLKKLGAASAKLIQERLVDPKSLQILYWQSDIVRDATFDIIFRVKTDGGPVEVKLTESTGETTGPRLRSSYGTIHPPVEPKQVASELFKLLKGWSGLKGEPEKNVERHSVGDVIKIILSNFARQQSSTYDDKVDVSRDGLSYSIGFRLNSVDSYSEWERDEILDKNSTVLHKKLVSALGENTKFINQTFVTPEEKGWWTAHVTLK
jgi:hypothetical protein